MRYGTYFLFFLYFIINIPILNNFPFSLDYGHFAASVNWIANPIYAWFPWSIYFKSWPLSFSIFWVIFEVFGESVVIIRFLNLCLHFLNYLIFCRIIRDHQSGHKSVPSKTLAILFLFHPLAVLPVSWGFQLKTLLATTLILILFWMTHQKIHNKKKILFFFWLSLTAKVQGILFPIYYLLTQKLPKAKDILFIVILFFISGFYGLINIKGITYISSEIKNITKTFDAKPIEHTYRRSEIESSQQANHKSNEPINFNINIQKEMKQGAGVYIRSIDSWDKVLSKTIIALINLGRLSTFSIGLNHNLPFYAATKNTFDSSLNYAYIFLGLGYLLLTLLKKNKYLFFGFLLYLPISGLFYVPYMKYSYTSDHWFYPASALVLLGLFKMTKNKYFWNVVGILILTNFISTQVRYSDFEKLLIENFKENKNPIALESTLFYKAEKAEWDDIYQINQYLLNQADSFDPKLYETQLKASIILNREKTLESYMGRFLSQHVKSQDELAFELFLQKHKGYVSEDKLNLFKAFASINKGIIKQKDYVRLIKHLKLQTKDPP